MVTPVLADDFLTESDNCEAETTVSHRSRNLDWDEWEWRACAPSKISWLYSQPSKTKRRAILCGIREISEPEQAFGHLDEAINASLYILDLPDDWDEEGSSGYEKNTWQRAVRFLYEQARFAFHRLDVILDAPKILPGPDGSIDLHWKRDDYELLVNVPDEPVEPAEYYGDNRAELMPIRGSCNPAKPDRKLISWLILMKQ